MSVMFENPLVGGTVLRQPAIQSPNFNAANPSASPSPSWAILQSGLAYFFGLVLSGGTITGPDYIINSSGIFIYSGTPANGNLIGSWAGASGTDTFGNSYPQGINITKGAISGTSLTGGTITGTTFNGTNFVMNSSGAFFYNGTPALGNLSQSITDGNGTDGFGNTYLQGITTYSPISGSVTGTIAVTSVDATVTFYYSTSTTGSGTWRETGQILCQPTTSNTGPNVLLFEALDNTGSSTLASIELNADPTTPQFKVEAGALISTLGTVTNPSLITTDAWHGATLTTPGNWTINASPEYKLYPDNTVGISGELTAAANVATQANLLTLPTAYRPATAQRITACTNNGTTSVAACLITISTAGVVQTIPAIATGNTLNLNIRFPLDS